MSLEQGIADLVNSDATVQSIATNGGGFLVQLPTDFLNADGSFNGAPTWTILRAGGRTEHTLSGLRGPREALIQIDCMAVNPADAVNLSIAIDAVLDGFSGAFFDSASPPNATAVLSCLEQAEPFDHYDTPFRTWRRVLEYLVLYNP